TRRRPTTPTSPSRPPATHSVSSDRPGGSRGGRPAPPASRSRPAQRSLAVWQIGSIADPLRRHDCKVPGEQVEWRGVTLSMPRKLFPARIGGLQLIAGLLQPRAGLVVLGSLDDRVLGVRI